MPVNVQSIASLPYKANQTRLLTAKNANEEIFPNENKLWSDRRDGGCGRRGKGTLRLADGPDEVHKILIAKNVLKHYHSGGSWDFGN
ncbi:MAG TPA: hypothetical protein EYQ60_01060 [Myxococcales bacterium]|nr:hypothetical protein [Myxococcales bacterium]